MSEPFDEYVREYVAAALERRAAVPIFSRYHSDPWPVDYHPPVTSPRKRAEELVARWEVELGAPIPDAGDPHGTIVYVHMTNDVRELMTEDIVKMLNEVAVNPSALA